MFKEISSDVSNVNEEYFWKKVESSIEILLVVPEPNGDFVFAPYPADVKIANENLDNAITSLQALGISVTREEVWKLAAERNAWRQRL